MTTADAHPDADHAHHDHDHDHDHDKGLSHDLPRLVGRRGLFAMFGGVGAAAAVAACGTDSSGSTATSGGASTSSSSAATTDASDAAEVTGEIPEETAGPYPGDGSNGPDVLSESGVVRSDITSSFGDASGTAEGVPLTIRLRVFDADGDDVTPYAGAAVYAWHCDREGRYSLYDSDITEENYLRGVQEADESGALEFTSIFPAAYSGRWPHVHFEVYPSLDDATSASNRLRTSQLALPEDVCDEVYAGADGYEASVQNMQRTSLADDMVFSDGYSLQLATVTGSPEKGYVASLNVPV